MTTHPDIQALWPTTWQPVPEQYQGAEVSAKIRGTSYAHRTYLLAGGQGTGKTRQAWAILQRQQQRRDDGLPWTHVWMISEAMDIGRHRWDQDRLEGWATYPGLLVVDDLGYACQAPGMLPDQWCVRAAYVISETRTRDGLRTMWTTNLLPDRIEQTYGPSIRSRLCSGLVLTVGGQDHREGTP